MATVPISSNLSKRSSLYILGYGLMGFASVMVSRTLPGASTFVFSAIILLELIRFSLQLRGAAKALRADVETMSSGARPQALVGYVARKREAMARGNEPAYIALWFGGIIALSAALLVLPFTLSASLAVWPTVGMIVYVFARSAANRRLIKKMAKI